MSFWLVMKRLRLCWLTPCHVRPCSFCSLWEICHKEQLRLHNVCKTLCYLFNENIDSFTFYVFSEFWWRRFAVPKPAGAGVTIFYRQLLQMAFATFCWLAIGRFIEDSGTCRYGLLQPMIWANNGRPLRCCCWRKQWKIPLQKHNTVA